MVWACRAISYQMLAKKKSVFWSLSQHALGRSLNKLWPNNKQTNTFILKFKPMNNFVHPCHCVHIFLLLGRKTQLQKGPKTYSAATVLITKTLCYLQRENKSIITSGNIIEEILIFAIEVGVRKEICGAASSACMCCCSSHCWTEKRVAHISSNLSKRKVQCQRRWFPPPACKS